MLDDSFGSERIVDFIRKFGMVRTSERRYINAMTANPIAERLEELTDLPINNCCLTSGQLSKILEHRLKLT